MLNLIENWILRVDFLNESHGVWFGVLEEGGYGRLSVYVSRCVRTKGCVALDVGFHLARDVDLFYPYSSRSFEYARAMGSDQNSLNFELEL